MSRISEAKEKTEMAEIKERAEMKKLELTSDAFTGIDSEALKKSTLIRAINEEFKGSTVLGSTITTADEKYDIWVDKNLNITVAKHGELPQSIKLSYKINKTWRKIVIIPTIEGVPATYEEFAQSVLDGLPTDETERNEELNRIFVDGFNYTMSKNGQIPEGTTLTIEEITNGYTSIQEFYNDNMSTQFDSCEAMMISCKFVEPAEYDENAMDITINCSNGESQTINTRIQSSAEFEITENVIYIFTAIGPNGETGKLIIEGIEDNPEINLLPGLYNAEYEILKTWEQLKIDGDVTVEGTTLTRAEAEGNLVISDEIKTIGNGSSNLVDSFCGEFGCNNNITKIYIPSTVEKIARSAFRGYDKLKEVVMENGLNIIEDSAFYYCSGLTSITIPSSVTSIGSSAFSGCTGLTRIKVNESNQVYDSRNDCNAIIKTDTNELIQGCSSTTIPNDITSIGSSAFSGCTGLTSITIPSSVTSIGDSAFSGCTGLTSITIPSSVTSIGDSAISECTGLTSITIPSSVTSIGSYAISGCTGLTSITIPSSVTSIGSSAFYGCTGLTSITIPSSVTSIGGRAFYGCTGLKEIKCEAKSRPSGWESNWYYDCSSSIIKWGQTI